MKFSEREMKMIAAAEKRLRNTLCFRCVCALMLLLNIVFFMFGQVSEDQMLIFTLGILFAAAAFPQWGTKTPSYEQLVDILVDKSRDQEPVVAALTSPQRKGGWTSRRLKL